MECYTSTGARVAPGSTWEETYNGVKYHCVCRRNGGPDCKPVSSSAGGSSGGARDGNSFQTEMMESVVAPMVQNFFDWLFSSPSSEQSSQQTTTSEISEEDRTAAKARDEEMARRQAEYQENVKKQVEKAKAEYLKMMYEKFGDQKQATVGDFKDRYAKSEAIKTIKYLNCAAFQSVEAAKIIARSSDNMKDLDGPMEKARAGADFTLNKSTDCPPVKTNVTEVTAQHPISVQEVFYQTIKYKVDSIAVNVSLLKKQDEKLKQTIEEKKQKVENMSDPTSKKSEDDELKRKALAELNATIDDEKKLQQEINNSQKSIETYDKMRRTYDIKKPE